MQLCSQQAAALGRTGWAVEAVALGRTGSEEAVSLAQKGWVEPGRSLNSGKSQRPD